MSKLRHLETMPPDDFRRQMRRLLANRDAPEAVAMYQVLMKYAHKRVLRVSGRCGGRLSPSRQEELVADILLQLMDGGLARFRGGSLPELLAFVRTIADRTTWRAVRAADRERATLAENHGEIPRGWSSRPRAPDDLEIDAESALSQADRDYLLALLRAGSKAELARAAGVSRAAVTQRIQRILARVEALSPGERMAHEVWLRRSARAVLEAEPPAGG